jgi:peroxiredoxin
LPTNLPPRGSIRWLAVNDVFVMSAWAKQSGAEGKITMLADGSGLLTKALGLELDLVARGLGVRAQRFAMLLDDAKVVHLAVEPAGGYGVTSAEQLLAEV